MGYVYLEMYMKIRDIEKPELYYVLYVELYSLLLTSLSHY